MLSNNGLPRYCSLLTSPRCVPVRVNWGAGDPTAGSSPTVLIGFPRSVIWAIRTVCQRRLSGSRQGSATPAGNVDVHSVELCRVDALPRRVDVGTVESLDTGDLATRQRVNRRAVQYHVEALALQGVDRVLGIAETGGCRGRRSQCGGGECPESYYPGHEYVLHEGR